jgi:hypothetical protein
MIVNQHIFGNAPGVVILLGHRRGAGLCFGRGSPHRQTCLDPLSMLSNKPGNLIHAYGYARPWTPDPNGQSIDCNLHLWVVLAAFYTLHVTLFSLCSHYSLSDGRSALHGPEREGRRLFLDVVRWFHKVAGFHLSRYNRLYRVESPTLFLLIFE